MSFEISSRVYPRASRAAILAMGKPVALEASAEDRATRGFISITTIRPVRGSTANWMLQPPVSTPTARMIAMAVSRIRWYSRSVSVMAGATVTESPVCTPIGSMFSIEHTTTALSWWSRISSSSNSFQPRTDSSSSTCPVGLASSPAPAIRRSCVQALVHGVADQAARHLAAEACDDLLEPVTVLTSTDSVDAGDDQPHTVLAKHAGIVQRDCGVERRLTTERGQHRVRPFPLDHLGDHLGGDRLNVGRVREFRIGHDRRGVGVDQAD